MPRLNGFQFLRELKQDIQLKGIPIVIYTASKHEEDLDETKELGAEHFFSKPNSFMELCQIVRDVFAKELIHLK